jgi:hypothetical protein
MAQRRINAPFTVPRRMMRRIDPASRWMASVVSNG